MSTSVIMGIEDGKFSVSVYPRTGENVERTFDTADEMVSFIADTYPDNKAYFSSSIDFPDEFGWDPSKGDPKELVDWAITYYYPRISGVEA